MKATHALSNISRAAALAAMALVIIVSLHAGVEALGAVLRGMVAFLILHWVLGAAAEAVELTWRSSRKTEGRAAAEAQPQSEREDLSAAGGEQR